MGTHRILVVDDLPDWRSTLGGLLGDEGYAVQTASTAREALDYLESNPVDLALLDVRLDETDESNREGLSLASEISRRWPQVRIVIITGYSSQEVVREAFAPRPPGSLPVADYLEKTNADQVVRVVRAALAKA